MLMKRSTSIHRTLVLGLQYPQIYDWHKLQYLQGGACNSKRWWSWENKHCWGCWGMLLFFMLVCQLPNWPFSSSLRPQTRVTMMYSWEWTDANFKDILNSFPLCNHYSDRSTQMLARRIVLIKVNWWYRCWGVYSSCPTCEASKGA